MGKLRYQVAVGVAGAALLAGCGAPPRIAHETTAPAVSPRASTARVEASHAFDILPASVLAQLTKDQAAMQRAAQKKAFTAPVGETIIWTDGGRTGSAMAEDETIKGGLVCRTFIQAVQFTITEERAITQACRNSVGVWTASLNLSEMEP